MKFKVHITNDPNPTKAGFKIEGENLLDAIKADFKGMVRKSSYPFVPFRFPMTASVFYKKGILGGQGGVVVHCEWLYEYETGKSRKETYEVWIHAKEEDLEEEVTFTVE